MYVKRYVQYRPTEKISVIPFLTINFIYTQFTCYFKIVLYVNEIKQKQKEHSNIRPLQTMTLSTMFSNV